MKFKIFKMN